MGRALGRRRHLPLRPLPPPGRGLLGRLAAADRQRLAAHRARPVLHAHRPRSPLPADARAVGVLPGRLGRQRAADRAPGAERLRGPVRADPAVRPRLPATVHSGPAPAGAGEPARVRRAVPAAVGRGRGRVRRGLAPARAVGGLVAGLRDHRRAVPAHRAAGVPGRPRPRRRLPGRRADALGRRLRHRGRAGRAGGPRGRRRLVLARVRTVHCGHHPAGAAAGLRGAGGAPVRRPVRRPGRLLAAHAGVRRRRAGAGAPAGRAGQGHRAGHGLHVRRPHRRDLVARARPADPAGAGPGRAVPGRAAGRRRPGGVRAAGRADRVLGPAADGGAARRGRRAARAAAADPAQRGVLRERSPSTGDSRRVDSGTCATAAATPSCGRQLLARGPGAALAPGAHAGPVRGLGARAGRRLAGQPAAVLRRADPGLVRDLGDRRDRASTGCCGRRRCRWTRRSTCRRGSPRTSGTGPAGSPPTGTCSTPGPPRR